MSLYTFDIDGTLARSPAMHQDFWRQLMLTPEAERQYYLDLQLAHPRLPAFMWNLLGHKHEIGIITARSMRDKSVTVDWLQKHGIPYSWLIVNMDSDERVPFLKSVKPVVHFDDHQTPYYHYPNTCRVWYNDWDIEDRSVFVDRWDAIIPDPLPTTLEPSLYYPLLRAGSWSTR